MLPRSSSPFRVSRIILSGDEFRLAEADYLHDVWDADEAYMLSFEEGHDVIIGGWGTTVSLSPPSGRIFTCLVEYIP